MRLAFLVLLALFMTACASTPSSRGGGKYGRYNQEHDSIPANPPNLDNIPDLEPIDEPRSAGGNKDYDILGKHYRVLASTDGYREQGYASWYGEKFHGHLTSNGEIYDMYSLSAAHKTLPLPSYVRVTNLDNGKSTVVRVNDRGPFHDGRVIDLSYAAAYKLGMLGKGTAPVMVEALVPGAANTGALTAMPLLDITADDLGGGAIGAAEPVATLATTTSNVAMTTIQTPPPVTPSAVPSSAATKPTPTVAKPITTAPATTGATGIVHIQIVAISDAGRARKLADDAAGRWHQPTRVVSSGGLHKVQIGPIASLAEAQNLLQELKQGEYPNAFMVY